MKKEKLLSSLRTPEFRSLLTERLGIDPDECDSEIARIERAITGYDEMFGGDRDLRVFSVGGRSEISGNHTDHNGGKAITAAVNISVIAVAAARDDGTIRIKSEGYDTDTVTEDDLLSPRPEYFGKSFALIAGCRNAFSEFGLRTGGFDAFTVSSVPAGSGLSSSAAFEVTVCKMVSSFYNGDCVDEITLAKAAQYAENKYFGKPCGLMDQAACAVGGFAMFDFSSDETKVKKLDLDLSKNGFVLCITDTGGDHCDLTAEYAAIPAEMKKVASFFGKNTLSEVESKNAILDNIATLRKYCGDRTVLRTLHFFDENERVEGIEKAMAAGDMDSFLRLILSSGDSSFKYLQNVTADVSGDRSLSLALYLSERFFETHRGAARVHGGGFAGTVQAFVKKEDAAEYKNYIENYFGESSCHILRVRSAGAERLF